MSESIQSFAARCALRAPERLTIAVREWGSEPDDLIRPIVCSAQEGALRLLLDDHDHEWTVNPDSGEHYQQDVYGAGILIIDPEIDGGPDAAVATLLACDKLTTDRVITVTQ